MIKELFKNRSDGVTFSSFAGFYWSVKIFLQHVEGYNMKYD